MRVSEVTKLFLIAMLLLLAIASQQVRADDEASTLTFGIVPQQSATRLATIWVPFLDRLAGATGLRIVFATAKDIPTFEDCLAQGAYDIAYMNPYHYVEFHEDPGYRAIAHQSGKRLKGIVVARRDSDIAALADLAGLDVAFPSPAAFGASVLSRAEMKMRGIDFTPHYVKSHDSVYRAVSEGLYPAGGGVARTFRSIPDDLRSTLKIVHETAAYTPHAFAVHPSVSDEIAELIAAGMTDGAIGPDILGNLGMAGIERAVDANWNDVRSLGLTRDQTLLQQGDTLCRSD